MNSKKPHASNLRLGRVSESGAHLPYHLRNNSTTACFFKMALWSDIGASFKKRKISRQNTRLCSDA